MSDETPVDTLPTTTDEPKAEKPAPEATREVAHVAPAEPPVPAPQAEASIEQETSPDPEQAPEPELAEVTAAVVRLHEPDAEQSPADEPAAGETAEVPAGEPEAAPESEPAAKPAKKPRTRTTKAAAVALPTEEPTDTAAVPAEPTEPTEPKPENKKRWYAVKVQSGREDTIKAAILRKVAIEGLEEFFGEIAIPVEEVIEKKQVRVKDKKTDEYVYQEKKVTKKKKKFHGYIFANVEFNDRILYLFRETSGVGDFLNVRGSPGAPMAEPMPDHEVQAMLTGVAVKDPSKKIKIKLDFEKGDKVRIREGSFANQEGEVKAITDAKDPNEAPKVTVLLTFWGRPLDVEVEANQVEKI